MPACTRSAQSARALEALTVSYIGPADSQRRPRTVLQAEDVVELLSTNGGEYDAACGMDYVWEVRSGGRPRLGWTAKADRAAPCRRL